MRHSPAPAEYVTHVILYSFIHTPLATAPRLSAAGRLSLEAQLLIRARSSAHWLFFFGTESVLGPSWGGGDYCSLLKKGGWLGFLLEKCPTQSTASTPFGVHLCAYMGQKTVSLIALATMFGKFRFLCHFSLSCSVLLL